PQITIDILNAAIAQ
ncbi:unnamed protein product, partial [Rotaria magnacalcarata]